MSDKGSEEAIQAIKSAIKHTVLQTDINVEFDTVDIPDGGMIRRENTGHYTITIRMRVLDKSVKRTLVRGAW